MKPNVKKIFISHSSRDKKIVEKVVDIIEIFGATSNNIFCSSFVGYGIELGEIFLERLKSELNNEVLVLFIITPNFYQSPICLCEMGATWVKTNQHIPIIIPPMEYSDLKGVIPNTQGMRINSKENLNQLKSIIENFLELLPLESTIWERKRDKTLTEIENILDVEKENFIKLSSSKGINFVEKSKKEELIDYMKAGINFVDESGIFNKIANIMLYI